MKNSCSQSVCYSLFIFLWQAIFGEKSYIFNILPNLHFQNSYKFYIPSLFEASFTWYSLWSAICVPKPAIWSVHKNHTFSQLISHGILFFQSVGNTNMINNKGSWWGLTDSWELAKILIDSWEFNLSKLTDSWEMAKILTDNWESSTPISQGPRKTFVIFLAHWAD